MLGVIRSYQELTGFQPVELSDNSFAAVGLLSANSTSHRLVNFCEQSSLTPINSSEAKLAELKINN